MSGCIDCNTKRSMNTSQQTEYRREKIQALSLAKEWYSMKVDLLKNATVVDDAIRFVSQKSKDDEKLKASSSSTNRDDKEESKKPDYDEDEDEDQLEEEQEEIGEMTTVVAKQDTKVKDIIDIMDKKGIDLIPIAREETDGRLVGVVSRLDILAEKMNERFVTIERKSISNSSRVTTS
jgi:CBS domain-containing protein